MLKIKHLKYLKIKAQDLKLLLNDYLMGIYKTCMFKNRMGFKH
jgi:hypothetical protein